MTDSSRNKLRFLLILAFLTLLIIILIAFIISKIQNNQEDTNQTQDNSTQTQEENVDPELQKAITAGQQLSNGKCSGTGSVELTALPMNVEDFSILIPYGLVIGGHVTPIDHQYFSPTIFNSPRDTYKVYAPADGTIVDIGPRDRVNPNNPNDKFQEYRIVFSHTCTFLSYYDLVTSLSPELQAEYDKTKNAQGYNNKINFPVKAGQVIGKIGGQTLDFAVWDTEKPLTGFVIPENYSGEFWKIYTANPYDYFTEELAQILKEKNPRTVEPIQGKIDYDIDGKLIGTWFKKGSGGYASTDGEGSGEYWKGHLSIAPNLYDPTAYIFSTGDFNGSTEQLLIINESFDPTEINVESGLQKLSLKRFSYLDQNRNMWDQMSLTKNPTVVQNTLEQSSCALVQMTGDRELKVEIFANQNCNNVSGFEDGVMVYAR